jgi:hypothetical protein
VRADADFAVEARFAGRPEAASPLPRRMMRFAAGESGPVPARKNLCQRFINRWTKILTEILIVLIRVVAAVCPISLR